MTFPGLPVGGVVVAFGHIPGGPEFLDNRIASFPNPDSMGVRVCAQIPVVHAPV